MTCYLPLSNNPNIDKDLGTRHRAGIGVTENANCFVIIVSEETGAISWVENGKITYGVTPDKLRYKLKAVQRRKQKAREGLERGLASSTTSTTSTTSKTSKTLSLTGITLDSKLVSNLKSKVIAFVAALMTWLAIINILNPNTTKLIKNIPITITNSEILTSEDQTYKVTNGDTVSIVVRGRRNSLDKLNESNILAVADMKDLSKVLSMPININIEQTDVDVIGKSKDTVRVEIDDIVEMAVPIKPVVIKKSPENTYIEKIDTEYESLIVKGAKGIVSTLDRVELEVDASNQWSDFTQTVVPKVYDRNGSSISLDKFEIEHKEIEVSIKMLKTKRVPFNINLNVDEVKNEDKVKVLDYDLESFSYSDNIDDIKAQGDKSIKLNDILIGASGEIIEGIESVSFDIDIQSDIENATTNKIVKSIDLNAVLSNPLKEQGIIIPNTNTTKGVWGIKESPENPESHTTKTVTVLEITLDNIVNKTESLELKPENIGGLSDKELNKLSSYDYLIGSNSENSSTTELEIEYSYFSSDLIDQNNQRIEFSSILDYKPYIHITEKRLHEGNVDAELRFGIELPDAIKVKTTDIELKLTNRNK